MLTENKINKNWDLFLATNAKYGNILSEEFLNTYGETLKTAKGEAHYKVYQYEGGLVSKVIKTTKFAVSLNNSLPESIRQNVDELIRFIFITHTMSPNDSHNKHAYKLMTNGVKLTEEEFYQVTSDLQNLKSGHFLTQLVNSAYTMARAEDAKLNEVKTD